MKNITVFILLQLLPFVFTGQITVISTGTPSPDRVHISVIDNKIVISGDYNFIRRSNDECNTFTPLTVPEPANSNILNRIDTSTCYMLTQTFTYSKIYKSINGGLTWTQKYNTNQDIVGLVSFDSSNIVGITNSYNIIKTNNGGMTWTVVLGPAQGVGTAKAYGDSTLFIGNTFGTIYISKNQGATWVANPVLPYHVSDISPFNKDTIFAIALNPNFGNAFSRSFNGGTSWQNFPLPPAAFYIHISFKNKNEGYVLGEDDNGKGIISKTTDMGQTWSTFNTGLNTGFNGGLIDMAFLNDSIALVSGYNGVLFKWNTKQTTFVGVKENADDDVHISVFPNPVKNKLVIEAKNNNLDSIKFNLFNALGQQLNFKLELTNSKAEIDIHNLFSGIYYLKVENDHSQKIFKIVKE